jgi:hypothetical protein
VRPFCGVFFFEFSFVSRLASYTAFALGPALGAALGYDCFLYVCPGGELGRVASGLYPFANWRIQRCHVGQSCGFDGAGSDISFSDLETAQNECYRRLSPRQGAPKKEALGVSPQKKSLLERQRLRAPLSIAAVTASLKRCPDTNRNL